MYMYVYMYNVCVTYLYIETTTPILIRNPAKKMPSPTKTANHAAGILHWQIFIRIPTGSSKTFQPTIPPSNRSRKNMVAVQNVDTDNMVFHHVYSLPRYFVNNLDRGFTRIHQMQQNEKDFCGITVVFFTDISTRFKAVERVDDSSTTTPYHPYNRTIAPFLRPLKSLSCWYFKWRVHLSKRIKQNPSPSSCMLF